MTSKGKLPYIECYPFRVHQISRFHDLHRFMRFLSLRRCVLYNARFGQTLTLSRGFACGKSVMRFPSLSPLFTAYTFIKKIKLRLHLRGTGTTCVGIYGISSPQVRLVTGFEIVPTKYHYACHHDTCAWLCGLGCVRILHRVSKPDHRIIPDAVS